MAFKNVKAQTERKNTLITRAENLVNTAQSENRELTEAEAAELAEIRDDIQRIKAFLKIVDDIDEARPSEKVEDLTEDAKDMIDGEAERACEESETRAFAAFIRGEVSHLRDGELSSATNYNGKLIPKTIARKIIAKVYDICPILERSEKYNIKGDLDIPYYPYGDSNITVAYASEFTDLASSTGNFDTISLGGFLAGALTKVSKSLVNNTDFDLVAFVVDQMAYAIARFIEKELLVGTPAAGANPAKVLGLSTATNVTTLSSTSAITGDDLIDVQDSVKDVFQDKCIWIMNSKTRTALRKLKDDVGRYLLVDDLASPFGKSLLGKPVYVSDNMPDIGAGAKPIYYGDMSGLATKFSEELAIEVLREVYAAQHAIGVVGWIEFDGKVANQQKIAVLKMANA